MVKIYGCSDDLVEIEGSKYPEDEIGCYDSDVKIWFSDGTENDQSTAGNETGSGKSQRNSKENSILSECSGNA